MDALTDKFTGYEQRDAHEFLSDLIDLLHEELTHAVSAAGGSGSGGNGEDDAGDTTTSMSTNVCLPTDEYFRLDVNVCLTCDNCRYSR